MTITKPQPSEHSDYAGNYIRLVTGNDLHTALSEGSRNFLSFMSTLPPEKYVYRYADGKWTIQDIVAHIIDCERIMTYRALTIARNDKTPLPGFEENDYAQQSNAANRIMKSLLEEYEHQRIANRLFFDSLTEEMSVRTGIANGKSISVRALGFVIAGHEIHHLNVIKERYL